VNIVQRNSLVSKGMLLVINGPSSAGKTTLARNLQQALSCAAIHLQLDAFRSMEPEGYFDRIDSDLRWLRVAALCRSINAACAQYLLHGQNVILDHALPQEGWQYLQEDLFGQHVLTVGVFCSLEELERREQQRPDRKPGLAASQFLSLHRGRRYDMQVDTTNTTSTDCAAKLAAWLEQRPKPHAFLQSCAAA